jgi:hypothetical protein
MPFPTLNLPAYPLVLQERGGEVTVFDPIRKKQVTLTPEEWVRQHFIQFLIRDRGFPEGLIAVERTVRLQGVPWRADIVAHDRQGRPALLVECKAPEVDLNQNAFDQIARYNSVLQASYLVVTNGRVHYCCLVDWERRTTHFVDDVPAFVHIARPGAAPRRPPVNR